MSIKLEVWPAEASQNFSAGRDVPEGRFMDSLCVFSPVKKKTAIAQKGDNMRYCNRNFDFKAWMPYKVRFATNPTKNEHPPKINQEHAWENQISFPVAAVEFSGSCI